MKICCLLLVAGLIALCGGCSTAETLAEGISAKSVSGSGTFVYNRVGLDATTQTPEMTGLFVWGDYTSVVPGDEVLRYEESIDGSVFNSAVKTYKKKIFYASGDKARMDAVLQKIEAGGGFTAGAAEGGNKAVK